MRTEKLLRIYVALVALIAAGGLSGCFVTPEPLTDTDISTFAADKLERVTAGQENLRGAISLNEAMARALKYNLDTQVEMAQAALRIKELDLSEYKMLPSLVANSGYMGRSNDPAAFSADAITGKRTNNAIIGQDRNYSMSDMTLSWNVLDFGLSYVRAQQLADEALIAQEMRRKVANRVMEDVRTAYWRAVSYQRLINRLHNLEGRAQRAIGSARRLYGEALTSPMLALAYERELIEIRREIQKMEGELLVAKDQLAALMNIEPGGRYSLVDSRSTFGVTLKQSGNQLVQTALENRPEMHEVAYKLRINGKEAVAALLELLPGAQLYLGGNVNSNSFLVNNNWLSYGARASWNLLKIVSYPARKETIDAQSELLDTRALAMTMAVMTQVHVARARYYHAQRELKTAADFLNVQNDILAQMRAQVAADKSGEQSLIREEMNALVAEVRFDLAHAQLQNAFATVYSSIGLDPYDSSVDLNDDVKTIASRLGSLWRQRGQSVGVKKAGLLRAPRRPKPIVTAAFVPPMPGQYGLPAPVGQAGGSVPALGQNGFGYATPYAPEATRAHGREGATTGSGAAVRDAPSSTLQAGTLAGPRAIVPASPPPPAIGSTSRSPGGTFLPPTTPGMTPAAPAVAPGR